MSEKEHEVKVKHHKQSPEKKFQSFAVHHGSVSWVKG